MVHAIQATGVRYLLVDWRMTKGVPPTPGYYFSPFEPGAGEYQSPFPAAALRKFAADPCTRLVYTTGAVQIFDVSHIQDGSCRPEAASAAASEGSP